MVILEGRQLRLNIAIRVLLLAEVVPPDLLRSRIGLSVRSRLVRPVSCFMGIPVLAPAVSSSVDDIGKVELSQERAQVGLLLLALRFGGRERLFFFAFEKRTLDLVVKDEVDELDREIRFWVLLGCWRRVRRASGRPLIFCARLLRSNLPQQLERAAGHSLMSC